MSFLRSQSVILCLLFLCIGIEGKVKIFGSTSGVTPPQKPQNKVWLYTSIAADYDGATMLPHFLKHYLDLGVKPENFLVVVNHNPEREVEGREDPVQDVTSILDQKGIKYRLWLDQYSSEKLYKIRLELLSQVPFNDWIIHADSDELHDYGTKDVISYLAAADKEGVNEIKGTYVDRVSANGDLTKITDKPGIFEQYPMKCSVIKNVAKGRDTKAMAYKGFWRTDRGNHQVLRPAKAKTYLGPSKNGEENRSVMDAEDLYTISPYAKNPDAYQYVCSKEEAADFEMPAGLKCFIQDKGKKQTLPAGFARKSKMALVHHFKWHAGVINSVKDRLEYYKGPADSSGDAEGAPGAPPRYAWFKDSENLMNGVVGKGSINLKENGCKR